MKRLWILAVALLGILTISVKVYQDVKKEKTKRSDILQKARDAKADKAILKNIDETEKNVENEN